MIERYTPKRIGKTWGLGTKYCSWLTVELAAIEAKGNLGISKKEIFEKIAYSLGRVDFRGSDNEIVKSIGKREETLEHDMLAFIEDMRSYLPNELKKYFHEGLTSYDTEVPALALQFREVGKILIEDLNKLIIATRIKASEHAWTFCMGTTHCQDAKPTTFGYRLCGYLEMLENGKANLQNVLDQIMQVKCSGAVGNHMTISPELEAEVCRILGLGVRRAATQIVGRDVFARFLSECATLGGVIEKIATDLRLLAHSRVGEVMEPRKKNQKGSSAMPHKRNPIILERMCGLPIVLRGFATMGQELIRTWLERDIAHSSVERIAFPDATCILDYMLQKMTWVINGLEVNRKRMVENINASGGVWASEEIKTALCAKNINPDEVYKIIQKAAFKAVDKNRDFGTVLSETIVPSRQCLITDLLKDNELVSIFDFKGKLLYSLSKAYKRMEVNTRKCTHANVYEVLGNGVAIYTDKLC